MLMWPFVRREDKNPKSRVGELVGNTPEDGVRHLIHVDMHSRGAYAVMVISESEKVIDMHLYKDHEFQGHVDTTQGTEWTAAVFASKKPEEFAEYCSGCVGASLNLGSEDEDSS
jgi:hypothetical protein